MESLYLNRLHFPVTTLGYGKRIGIWFQGCSIECPGCLVPDTWKATQEHSVPLPALYHALTRWLNGPSPVQGVTISGGEPFDQPHALLALLQHLRALTPPEPLDLLVYSGYSFTRLQRLHPAILEQADVLISGPFVEKLEDPRPFIGSANQEMHLLTPLARERYSAPPPPRSFSFDYQDGVVYLAGVPKRGEMARLEQRFKAPAE